MAKRFSRKDLKIGEESNGLVVLYRFMYEDRKYYVVKELNGTLAIWSGIYD